MDFNYILGQILGVAVTICAIVILQLKNKKQMLIVSVAVNILASFNILLLDGLSSGVLINLVAVIQIGLSLWHEYKTTDITLIEKISFLVLYLAGGIVGFKAPIDILSIVAAIFYMLAMLQKKEQHIRLFLLANMLSWTVYHAVLGSTVIFAQFAGIASSLIALYRYRNKKGEKKMKSFTELPSGYNEIFSVDLQKDKKKALMINGVALVIAAIMAVAAHLYEPVTGLLDFSSDMGLLLVKMLVLALASVLYIILHEAVHAIAMKMCGTKKVKFGFTGLYAFAGSKDYYNKKSYIFIALAPVILWGTVIAVINFLVPRDWFWIVYFIQISNISGAAGDFYVTLKFMSFPENILISDSGVGMKVYSK